jgi:hypothetical protein
VPLGSLQEISTGIDKSSSGATGWVGWAMTHPKIWRIFFTAGLPSHGSTQQRQQATQHQDSRPGTREHWSRGGITTREQGQHRVHSARVTHPTIRYCRELPPAGVSSLLCAPGALLSPPSVFSPSRTALVTSAPPSAPHSRTVWWRLRVSLTTSSSTWPPRLAECWRAALTGSDVTTTPMVP